MSDRVCWNYFRIARNPKGAPLSAEKEVSLRGRQCLRVNHHPFGKRREAETKEEKAAYAIKMSRHLHSLIFCWGVVTVASLLLYGQARQPDDPVLATLALHQYDLEGNGREFLLDEAHKNDFFLLGELHGDNEIPVLIRELWARMWKEGYRHVAAEVSPWAAYQLEKVPVGKGPEVQGLWTKRQADDVHALASPQTNVLWGCDMEEEQPQLLIWELAALNPNDASLKRMVEITKEGYSRGMASDLLKLALESQGGRDLVLNDVSLRQNLLATLQIEKDRTSPEAKMISQNERERLMKEQFLAHLHKSSPPRTPAKVLLRFGRNHLHSGYDTRGISTLGNFVAEHAISQGKKVFNVGAFGAGGKATLMGETFDADERQDELAFALLAEKAKYSATLYDLRPLRQLLHRIPQEKRSQLQTNLIYWADAYDALICYKTVTPLKQ